MWSPSWARLNQVEELLRRSPTAALLHERDSLVHELSLADAGYSQEEWSVRAFPEEPERRRLLVESQLAAGLYDHALESIRGAEAPGELRARVRALVGLGRSHEAAEWIEKERQRRRSPEEQLELAGLLFLAGEPARARAATDFILQDARAYAPALLLKSRLALWSGQHDEARATAEAISPGTPGLLQLRAAMALVEGRFQEAAAVAEDGDRDFEALLVQAEALRRQGLSEEAQRLAATVKAQSPQWLPMANIIERAAALERRDSEHVLDWVELVGTVRPLLPEMAFADRPPLPAAPLRRQLEAAIERVHGNFSATPTWVDDEGVWRPLGALMPARRACAKTFELIKCVPWPEVILRLSALSDRYPTSPLPHTHSAEVSLWTGDYAATEAACRRAIAVNPLGTRWAYVGLGAALMFQGREAAALSAWELGERRLGLGAPIFAYRGEARFRLGDLAGARRDLERGLELSPTRLSSHVLLGLIGEQEGREDALAHGFRVLAEKAPKLLRDACMDLDIEPPSAGDRETVARICRHTLAMMRGNRASQILTWFPQDGRPRLNPAPGAPAPRPS